MISKDALLGGSPEARRAARVATAGARSAGAACLRLGAVLEQVEQALGDGRPEPLPPPLPEQSAPAAPDATWFLGYDHAELADMATGKLDPGQVTELSAGWHRLGAALTDCETAIAEAGKTAPAEAIRAYLTSLGLWSRSAAHHARQVAEQLATQAEAAVRTGRALPAATPFDADEALRALLTHPDPAQDVGSIQDRWESRRDTHLEAAHLLSAQAAALTTSTTAPAFPPPPDPDLPALTPPPSAAPTPSTSALTTPNVTAALMSSSRLRPPTAPQAPAPTTSSPGPTVDSFTAALLSSTRLRPLQPPPALGPSAQFRPLEPPSAALAPAAPPVPPPVFALPGSTPGDGPAPAVATRPGSGPPPPAIAPPRTAPPVVAPPVVTAPVVTPPPVTQSVIAPPPVAPAPVTAVVPTRRPPTPPPVPPAPVLPPPAAPVPAALIAPALRDAPTKPRISPLAQPIPVPVPADSGGAFGPDGTPGTTWMGAPRRPSTVDNLAAPEGSAPVVRPDRGTRSGVYRVVEPRADGVSPEEVAASHASYLVEADSQGIFASDELTAPPVIGE
jgi:hypothetical protein